MFKFIKKIFNNTRQSSDLGVQINDDETNFINKTMKAIAIQELAKKDFFRQEYSSKILEHILGNIDLNKSNEYLSSEEKGKLEINKRVKISRELIEVFNLDKIIGKNPKELLSNLQNQVRNKSNMINSIRKSKEAGFKSIKLLNTGGERSCKWCITNDNKKIKIDDAIKLIDKNCKCDFIRAVFIVDL